MAGAESTGKAPQEDNAEINLTPMLDVVFIMLIFFIVTAAFVREHGIDVDRPNAAPRPVTESNSILIAIDEDNGIWVDRRLTDIRAVRPNIERLHLEDPHAAVVIAADGHSSNDTLVQVLDASRAAGIYAVSLAAPDGKE